MVPDTNSRSLFHFPHQCPIGDFRKFISNFSYNRLPICTTLGKMTGANKMRNAQHFGSDLAVFQVQIWINLEIRIQIPDPFGWGLTTWWRFARLVITIATIEVCCAALRWSRCMCERCRWNPSMNNRFSFCIVQRIKLCEWTVNTSISLTQTVMLYSSCLQGNLCSVK